MNLFKPLRKTHNEVRSRLDQTDKAILKKRQLEEDDDHHPNHTDSKSTSEIADRKISKRSKRSKRSKSLDIHPTPKSKPEMDSDGDEPMKNSSDQLASALGNLELDRALSEEERVRQEMREWAALWSTGEISPNARNPRSGQGNVNQPEPQASSSSQGQVPSSSQVQTWSSSYSQAWSSSYAQASSSSHAQASSSSRAQGEGLQPQDTSQSSAEDPTKRPTRPVRHRRHGAQNNIAFSAPEIVRPAPQHVTIPPVPPIPEMYREEWQAQQRARQLREAESDAADPTTPRAQRSRGERQVAIRREPQVNQENEDVPVNNEGTIEAAKRENERRRRAFTTVVEEDQGERSSDKGRSTPSDVARAQAPAGPSQSVRPESRLPRSPGMLHLSQQVPRDIPDPFIGPPTSRFQVQPTRQNMHSRDEDVFEDSEPGFLTRRRGGLTRSYPQALARAAEEAEMEAKAAERETKGKFKEE